VGELTFTDGTAGGGRRLEAARLTLVAVDILDEPERDNDAEREVDFESEEVAILPDQTRDDTERGWGERGDTNDDRLLEDRPPHWG
jgi:hypothetical protein